MTDVLGLADLEHRTPAARQTVYLSGIRHQALAFPLK